MFAHTCTKRRLRGAAIIAGALASAAVFVVTTSVLGIEVTVPERPGGLQAELTAPRVIALAAVGGLLAVAAALLVEKLGKGSPRLFVGVTMLGLALSFIPFLAIEGDPAAKAALIAMHVAVAAVAVPLLARSLRLAP
jgi:hypothetical protein